MDSTVNTTILYSAAIWGQTYCNIIKKCQINYIKNILGCHKYTTCFMIRLDAEIYHKSSKNIPQTVQCNNWISNAPIKSSTTIRY